jgi:hypothetical protein
MRKWVGLLGFGNDSFKDAVGMHRESSFLKRNCSVTVKSKWLVGGPMGEQVSSPLGIVLTAD